jgi:acyl carrier protein
VFLETIPKGATGKLQRIGLAEKVGLEAFDPVLVKVPHVAPRTPVEEVVAAAWAEVLRTDTPGIDDNFFAAGGDSITAAQLVSRVRDLLRVELPLLAFFDAPSVAGAAAEVEALLAVEQTAADGAGTAPA